MRSVHEAEKAVLAAVKLLPVEICALKDAAGRILREEIKTDRDQPPFNKTLMDGIAICYDSWKTGRREFEIEHLCAAGDVPYKLKNKNNCVQVMTGAVLPLGCDCVIAIEQVEIEGHIVQLNAWTLVNLKQNIRFQGADHKKGDILLKSGCLLQPPQIAIAACVGKTQLKVSQRPNIAIIATGNELVDIGKPIKNHETRLSNSYALNSLFIQSGLAKTHMFHLPDKQEVLLNKIRTILASHDVIVLSGGVSMGEFDYVPDVLMKLGVKAMVHKVTQKPGKPFWFGVAKGGKPVFALPGNPVSTVICAYRYVMPYLAKAAGLIVYPQYVRLDKPIDLKTDLTYFAPVKVKEKDGIRLATLVDIGGSGDFAALAYADGFIQYESDIRQIAWPYFSWRA